MKQITSFLETVKFARKQVQLSDCRKLDELADADNLAVMRFLPQSYCHELKGNRANQLAVKLDKGYRMVFEPANHPGPKKKNGGLDWTQVTAIRILELSEDYHD